MQSKNIRYCDKLIKYIFLKTHNKKSFIYLSSFEDSFIVYTRDENI